MSGRVFFDSNIVLYAFDRADDRRQPPASRLLEEGLRSGTSVLSLQVLQEFYWNITRKVRIPLAPPAARAAVADLMRHHVVEPTAAHILRAIDLSIVQPLSFWDALIVVCAAVADCGILYTEDLSHGAVIAGVRIVNPFR